jgi:hypothetical protein
MLKGRRFTPAMIVAMIALAVALSGTAVAGTKLITGNQIKNGTIKLADLHSSVKTAIKGAASHTSGAQGPQGAQGPAGPQGAAGAKGDTGATGTPGPAGKDGKDGKDGISGLVTRHYDYIKGVTEPDYPGAGSGGIATVACDDDPAVSQTKVAIGGGVQFLNVGRNVGTLENPYVGDTHITDSFPGRMDWNTNTPKANRLDGWIVRLNTTPSVDMRVWVTCVDAPPAPPAS